MGSEFLRRKERLGKRLDRLLAQHDLGHGLVEVVDLQLCVSVQRIDHDLSVDLELLGLEVFLRVVDKLWSLAPHHGGEGGGDLLLWHAGKVLEIGPWSLQVVWQRGVSVRVEECGGWEEAVVLLLDVAELEAPPGGDLLQGSKDTRLGVVAHLVLGQLQVGLAHLGGSVDVGRLFEPCELVGPRAVVVGPVDGPGVEKVEDGSVPRVQGCCAAVGDLSPDKEGSRLLHVGEGEACCVQQAVLSLRRGGGLLWVLEPVKMRHRLHRVGPSARASALVVSLRAVVPARSVVPVVVSARGVLPVPLGRPLVVGVVRLAVAPAVLALRFPQHRLLRSACRAVARDRRKLLQ